MAKVKLNRGNGNSSPEKVVEGHVVNPPSVDVSSLEGRVDALEAMLEKLSEESVAKKISELESRIKNPEVLKVTQIDLNATYQMALNSAVGAIVANTNIDNVLERPERVEDLCKKIVTLADALQEAICQKFAVTSN